MSLPENYLKGLQELARRFFSFLHKHDIEYWIDGGTLLGAIREQGQIKHDNDIDIGMFKKALKKLAKYKDKCEKECGIVFQFYTAGILKVFDLNINYMKGDEKITACIDIFYYAKEKNRIQLWLPTDKEQWPNSYHSEKDFYPLKKYPFGDIQLFGVNNPYPYLERQYGDWKTPVIYDTHFL